jgi:hypothetical protein
MPLPLPWATVPGLAWGASEQFGLGTVATSMVVRHGMVNNGLVQGRQFRQAKDGADKMIKCRLSTQPIELNVSYASA